MTDTVESLVLDLVEWSGRNGSSYRETMEVWRTSCPKLPIWEEATERGLVEPVLAGGQLRVRATLTGLTLLERRRPEAYRRLIGRIEP